MEGIRVFYPKPMNRDLYLVVVGLAVLLVRYVFLQRPSELPETQAWVGLVSLALCLVPAFLFLRGVGSGPLPLMPAIGLFYCLAFALPVFIDFSEVQAAITRYSPPGESAVWVQLLAIVALLGSYYGSRSVIKPGSSFSIGVRASGPKLHAILWVFAAAHIADLYFHWTKAVFSLSAVIEAASNVSYGYLLLEMFAGNLSQGQKYSLFYVALPLEFLAAVTSGFISQPLQLLQMILFAYWLSRQKIPWASIIVCTVALIALQNVKDQYRRLVWSDSALANASSWQKLQVFTELAMQPQEESAGTALLANSVTTRLSQLAFLNRVVEMTPDEVPYWAGDTYKVLLYKLIPRFIWPTKPSETLGFEFSRRYGMRAPGDETTSINVPWIVEMYANFGGTGVFIGMAMVGVMFAWMDRNCNRADMLPLDRVIGLVMVGDLVMQESNFSLMVGNKVLVYYCLSFIFQAFLGRENEQHRPDPSPGDHSLRGQMPLPYLAKLRNAG
jgi:hypothetical protein